MRLKKLKAARKTMGFFRIHFKIRPPYKLIMDGCFLHNAYKVKFEELIRKLFQADVTIYITNCVRAELEQLGEKVADTLDAAKKLRVLKCGHKHSPLAPAECISKLVGGNNAKKYVVASTDTELMDKLREIAGLPLLYMDRSVLVLESPSPASKKVAGSSEKKKNAPSKDERRMLQGSIAPKVAPSAVTSEKASDSGVGTTASESQPAVPKKRKKPKGPKGPNPLSMKKKKKNKIVTQPGQDGPPKKRKRRKKKKSNSESGSV